MKLFSLHNDTLNSNKIGDITKDHTYIQWLKVNNFTRNIVIFLKIRNLAYKQKNTRYISSRPQVFQHVHIIANVYKTSFEKNILPISTCAKKYEIIYILFVFVTTVGITCFHHHLINSILNILQVFRRRRKTP